MTAAFELGLDTFGDITRDASGRKLTHAEALGNILEEAEPADECGIDFFGLGEHHRADFAISSPEAALAAVATRTRRIRLGSSVTVLSSDDPIRVFQRFATLDALSNGRAEVIVGRASFTESFSLLGFDLNQYEQLFSAKLDLFTGLLKQELLTWQGKLRPPLRGRRVFPPIAQGTLRTWMGVGGSPESVVRAAHSDLPMMLANIGGDRGRFPPYVELYHRAFAEIGHPARAIGVHSLGYVALTDEQACEEFWTDYKIVRDRIGIERGWSPVKRDEFVAEVERGSFYVGAPEAVARKTVATAKALHIVRFQMKYSAGPLPHKRQMRSIELFGRKVAPIVREMLL
jgi:probable LLM family oxidoreductase